MSDDLRFGKPWMYGARSWPVAASPTIPCAGCHKGRNRLSLWVVADGRRLCRPCLDTADIVPAGPPRRSRKRRAA